MLEENKSPVALLKIPKRLLKMPLFIARQSLRRFPLIARKSLTERLMPLIPPGRFVVTESGIFTRADIDRLLTAGARGFLIGESLMREDDIGAKLQELLESP